MFEIGAELLGICAVEDPLDVLFVERTEAANFSDDGLLRRAPFIPITTVADLFPLMSEGMRF